MSILAILDEIGSDNSRKHKLSVLTKYSDNKLLMQVISLALDPYVNFYIRKIPKYVPSGTQPLVWALGELAALTSRQLTGSAGILHLTGILSSLTAEDAIVIERIIGKDLRCGAADGIINAALGNIIPTYPCLLARPYDATNIANITYPALSQLKADGLRVNFHVIDGTVLVYSRAGRSIDLLSVMDSQFATLARYFSEDVVFDGELVVVNDKNVVLSRKEGNGIINKAIRGTISVAEAARVRVQLWDVIPRAEFLTGKSTKVYKDRYDALNDAISSLGGKLAPFWVVPTKIVNNIDEATAHYVSMLEAGEEGIILKNYCAYWEDGRSKHLVKMKAEKNADLEITGWNPGVGQYAGQVGSLICSSSDRLVEVAVSGFSQALRLDITKRIDELIGLIVEVKYNERIGSKARTGVDSLFLPRFTMFRPDKAVANSSDEIK